MWNASPNDLKPKHVWALKLIAILILHEGAICVALCPGWLVAAPPSATHVASGETARSTDYEECLVRSFVESAAAAKDSSAQIRVAVFQIGGSSRAATQYLPTIMKGEPACHCELVSAADIRASALGRFDVVVFPGGSGKKQGAALDAEGRRAVQEFVRGGGGYVGICAGAFFSTTTHDVYLALVNAKTNTRPGAATVEVEMTEFGKTTFAGFSDSFDARFSGGPILSPAARDDLSDYITLGLYRTEFSKTGAQRGTMVGTPAIIAARYGRGCMIAFSFHPEVLEGTQPLVKQAVLSTARDSAARAAEHPIPKAVENSVP